MYAEPMTAINNPSRTACVTNFVKSDIYILYLDCIINITMEF
jgi:hypothetical protein